jgi:hypothetical protein
VEELVEKVKNVLEHVCDIHDRCDVAWCYNMKAKESNKVYNEPKEHWTDKTKDPVVYLQLHFF